MKRIKNLRRDDGGQILIFTIVILFTILLFLLTVPNVGHVISAKIRTQTAADSGAYSAAVWQARGMNLITCLNIGIRQTYYWIAAITALFLICTVALAIGAGCAWTGAGAIIAVLAATVLNIFFGPTASPFDPCLVPGPHCATLIPTYTDFYQKDVKNLYNFARKLSRIQHTIAEMIPSIAFAEGSYRGWTNLEGMNWKFSIIGRPLPTDEIELEEEDKEEFLKLIRTFAAALDLKNLPGDRKGKGNVGFDDELNPSGSSTQEYIEKKKVTCEWIRHYCKLVPPQGEGSPDPTCEEYTESKFGDRTYKVDNHPEKSDGQLKEEAKRSIQDEDLVDWANHNTWIGCEQDKPPCEDYYYEFKECMIMDIWASKSTTVKTDEETEPPPLPVRIKDGYKPYTVSIVAHRATAPLVAGKIFKTSDVVPNFAIAQATFFSKAYDNGDIYTPNWEARLDSMSCIQDIIDKINSGDPSTVDDHSDMNQNASNLGAGFGETIRKIKDHVLLH